MDVPTPSSDLVALVAVALMLGARHGVDADHLAAIDGMTRFNARHRPALARRTGLWFSLGHGAVVLAVAVAVASMAGAWQAPAWLEPFGAWASIAVLAVLGLANLNAIRRAPADAVVTGMAWRSGWFAGFLEASGPWPIMGVGALFAVSFDTFSQAALMAVTGTALRGLAAVVVLAGAFVVGMLVTDGLNGWWVARLFGRTDGGAARASRIMGIGVAGVSLGTASLGAATRLVPVVSRWAQAHEAQFGLAVIGVMGASFLLGVAMVPAKAFAETAPDVCVRRFDVSIPTPTD